MNIMLYAMPVFIAALLLNGCAKAKITSRQEHGGADSAFALSAGGRLPADVR